MTLVYEREILLRETDATGVIYFSELQSLASEAFQNFLAKKGFSIFDLIENGNYLTPVVRAESEFLKPLFVGTPIRVEGQLERIGEHSFTIKYLIIKKYQNNSHPPENAGSVMITHVFVDKVHRRPIPVPADYRNLLNSLKADIL